MPVHESSLGAATTGRNVAISIAILAFSAFLIVTTEFLIVGLLPALSQDLEISISMAGQLVTLFAFTVMLAGPVLTAALAHLDRKRLFITILLVFAAANALAAASSSFWVLAIARVIPALALPVFWGTASETAGHLAGRDSAGQAIAKVYLGISAAMLLGIPLGTVAANAVGWRGAFWILAALSLLIALAMGLWMPRVARTAKIDFMQQARIFKERYFLANVLLSVVVFTAMFTGYTYLADLLQRVVGVAPAHTGWWLMGFGAVGLFGNWIGGRAVDRSPLRATALFLLLLATGMAALVPLAGAGLAFCLALAVWGIANTALYPVSQVRVMSSVTHAQALAGTTNVSAANAGIGLGAVLGGMTISGLGIEYLGYMAAGVALLALGLVPLVSSLSRQPAVLARVP
ncbi:MFS transporter [Pseudomonas monteilii]|uniref:MFS transporter n=1 Tax=Pseudomonas monteilii TaxID=76759 RepID=A0AAP7FKR6_9PSED|nr:MULTISPECIES: MFS transporter [Pseudomonas]AYN15660.1 MFS transporter [Pseudomonas monteilii]AYO00681.1 MFS transporter [Pseudomonas sp. LTGT-11-2Z]MCE0872697.1 MFS transporter [Pseudomonas monteilii]MCE0926053.1 MFS transporter [Pseudomonas monteilii]MCE0931830.1 MFS transporter [Pseudomonas monteilii]